jgi:hypothetical protein
MIETIKSNEYPMYEKSAALWAIGHIGRHKNALKLLIKEKAIEHIIRNA